MKRKNSFWNSSDLNRKQAFLFLFVLFLVACLVRYLMADFTKYTPIYPDELRDYDIARSLFRGEGFRIQNAKVTYQKNGYSQLISLTFGIKDVFWRIKAINLINVFVLCSSCFFVYLLGREWNMTRKMSLFMAVLSILWPNQLNSITFMSESIYVPMVLLGVWLYVHDERKPSLICSVILGVVSYGIYNIKERGFVFPAALVCIELLFPLFQWAVNYKKGQKVPKYSQTRMIHMLIYTSVFSVIFLLVKYYTYDNAPNEWWNISVERIFSFQHFIYGCYACIYYLIGIMLAVFCIPVITPIALYSEMQEEHQKDFLLLLGMNFMMAVMVSFRIAEFEDYGKIAPRLHLRYFGPQILLMIIFFIAIYILYGDGFRDKVTQRKYLLYAIIQMLAVVIIFKGIYRGSCVDHWDLHWTIGIGTNGYNWSEDLYSIIMTDCIMAMFLFGFYYGVVRRKVYSLSLFIGAVIFISLLNNCTGYREVVANYSCDNDKAQEIQDISGIIEESETLNYLVIADREDLKIFNVYSDYAPYLFLEDDRLFYDELIHSHFQEGLMPVEGIQYARFPIKEEGTYSRTFFPQSFDYLIVFSNTNTYTLMDDQKIDTVFEGEYFSVFRNRTPNLLPVHN